MSQAIKESNTVLYGIKMIRKYFKPEEVRNLFTALCQLWSYIAGLRQLWRHISDQCVNGPDTGRKKICTFFTLLIDEQCPHSCRHLWFNWKSILLDLLLLYSIEQKGHNIKAKQSNGAYYIAVKIATCRGNKIIQEY